MDWEPTRLLCPWDFSRQEDWSGLPFPSPGDLPNPGIKPRSPALQADSLSTELVTSRIRFQKTVTLSAALLACTLRWRSPWQATGQGAKADLWPRDSETWSLQPIPPWGTELCQEPRGELGSLKVTQLQQTPDFGLRDPDTCLDSWPTDKSVFL